MKDSKKSVLLAVINLVLLFTVISSISFYKTLKTYAGNVQTGNMQNKGNTKTQKKTVKKDPNLICKKTIGSLVYQLRKTGNGNTILMQIMGKKKHLFAKDEIVVKCQKSITIPTNYYFQKLMYYDIDNDKNNEVMIEFKESKGNMDANLYTYRIKDCKFQHIGFNNNGRYVRYPYYKEDISFGNKSLIIYYLNKYIDISGAKFQLLYSEKYQLKGNSFKLNNQDNRVINGPSAVNVPVFKDKNIGIYLPNRSKMQQASSYDYSIKQVSKKYKIPSVVLKAVAQGESGITQFSNGRPYVSFDGGIGIMQITPQTRIPDINAIAFNPSYNLEKGASELCEKWNYKYKNIIPRTDNDNRNIIENWYFPLWAYNGWHEMNNPNMIPYRTRYGVRNYAYQDRIFGICQSYMRECISKYNYSKIFPKRGLPSSSVVFKTPTPYHYGDVGVGISQNDTKPSVGNLRFNTNNKFIYWSYKDNDFGDFQKYYGIKIIKADNGNKKSSKESNDSDSQKNYKITVNGKQTKGDINFYHVNPMKVFESKVLKSKDNKYKVNRQFTPGTYDIYMFVEDKYNMSSDLAKLRITVN